MTESQDRHSRSTDESVRQSRLTDTAEFSRLYRLHYDAVFRYCAHRLIDRHLAEDLTAETFFKAAENLHRFRGDETNFRNWLYTIATNQVNSHLRKSARRRQLLKNAPQQAESSTARDDSTTELTDLLSAIRTLKPLYQTIITLHYYENLKMTEIAAIVGASPGTTRSRLARALNMLRRNLGDVDPNDPPEGPQK